MIIGDRRERPSAVSILFLFCLGLTMSLGTEWIPIPDPTANSVFIAALQTIAAIILFGLTLGFLSSERLTYFISLPPFFTTHRLATGYIFLSFLISTTILLFKSSGVGQGGSGPDIVTFWLVISFFVLLFAVQSFIKRPGFPSTIVLVSLSGYLVLAVFSLNMTPFVRGIDQPFSLYLEAIDRLFIGLDPYQVYDSINSKPLTALPGQWLSFIPIRLWDIDPRWIGILSTVCSVFLVYGAVPKNRRHLAAYCLSLYMLTPYVAVGSSNYTGLLPLAFSLVFFLSARGYYLAGAAAIGGSLTLSLYSWLILPFIFGFLFKKQSAVYWGINILISGLFAAMLLVPFGLISPDSFLYCTVNFWLETFIWNSFNISYWLIPLIGGYGLHFLQASFFMVLYIQYLKSKKQISACYTYFTIYTCFFIITNRVVEAYFFPLIMLQAIIGLTTMDENKIATAPINIHNATTPKS